MTHVRLLALATAACLAIPACGPTAAPSGTAAPAAGEVAAPGAPAPAPAATANAVPAPAPAPAAPKTVEGGDSPEDVVKRAQAAATAKDAGALIRLLEPAERPTLCAGMVMMPKMLEGMKGMMAGMAGGEDPKAKAALAGIEALIGDLEAVNTKHAVKTPELDPTKPPDEAVLRQAFEKVDVAAYLTDIFATMEKHKDAMPGKQGGPFDDMGKKMGGEITDLKVEGDRATAKIAGGAAEFVRADGRWFIAPGPGKRGR